MNNTINTSAMNNQYSQLRKQIAEQDVYRAFALNANSVAPSPAQGFLVKRRGPVSGLVVGAYDTGKDIVELSKAVVTGKSNDNQLGRFNDLGMKVSGLLIASYLATKHATKTKGLMEFAGFAAFFGSMAIWPELLINTPLKLKYGFDIRQKYIDSQGRKKLFFQDNQYQPWDMWSDEQIDKVADKMGIPKDVKDRRGLTKEKMRAIALQGNTLWMLTAGFSPLFTSLMCNLAERGITKGVNHYQQKELLNSIRNTDALESKAAKRAASARFDADGSANMGKLVKRYMQGAPDSEFFKNASELISPYRVIMNSNDIDNANIIGEARNLTSTITSNMESVFNEVRGTEKKLSLKELLANVQENTKASPLGMKRGASTGAMSDSAKAVAKKLGFEESNIDKAKVTLKEFEAAVDTVLGKDSSAANKAKSKAFELMKRTPDTGVNFKNGYEQMNQMYRNSRRISSVFETASDLINNAVGQKYESLTTSVHLGSLDEFISELHPTYNDLKTARVSTEKSRNFLEKTFAKIADNDGSYGAYVRNIGEKQEKFEADLLGDVKVKIMDFVDKAMENLHKASETDEALKNDKNFKQMLEMLGVSSDESTPFYKRMINLFASEKIHGVKATNHWQLLTADLERRIKDGTFEQQWLKAGAPADSLEEGIKYARNIAYECSMNALANKFYLPGNGEVVNKAVEVLFNSDMDKLTTANLPDVLKMALNETRSNIYKIYGSPTTRDYARLSLTNDKITKAVQKNQYSMTGKSLTELFRETADKLYNDKHWMKIFGGLAIGVVAVTLLTQGLFGKVKDEDLYLKEGKEQKGDNNAAVANK